MTGPRAGDVAPNCWRAHVSVTSAVRRAPHRRTAEYKQVTVLFADVVHSMDLAAAVGAERLREIMAELVRRADGRPAIRRNRRQVHRRRHHGAVRGAGGLEDHAFRACVAALGIQEEAAELAVDVKVANGIDLSLRIGLNRVR